MNDTKPTFAEHPILFSGPMVRAILDGRKTQTRRIVKPQPASVKPLGKDGALVPYHAPKPMQWMPGAMLEDFIKCPYGKPGDRLWVRETFFCNSLDYPNQTEHAKEELYYRANPDDHRTHDCEGEAIGPWRPSIFMPRWASRISLEIVTVRVQRLNEITEEDAIAEGLTVVNDMNWPANPLGRTFGIDGKQTNRTAWCAFSRVWDAINATRGFSWESNPWVWAVTFRRVEA